MHSRAPLLHPHHPALLQGQPGDLLLLAAGPAGTVNKALDRVRQYLARSLGLIKVGHCTALDCCAGVGVHGCRSLGVAAARQAAGASKARASVRPPP